MRRRRRPLHWVAMLGIDVGASGQVGSVESVRHMADAPVASAVLSVFSGVMWAIAAALLFFDLRAGFVAGSIATVVVWAAARRR